MNRTLRGVFVGVLGAVFAIALGSVQYVFAIVPPRGIGMTVSFTGYALVVASVWVLRPNWVASGVTLVALLALAVVAVRSEGVPWLTYDYTESPHLHVLSITGFAFSVVAGWIGAVQLRRLRERSQHLWPPLPK